MKAEIVLTKTEKILQSFLLVSSLLSFVVIGFGVYFQNNNIDKDHLLVPILLSFWLIFFGILFYNGLRNGNLIKRWTPIDVYNFVSWLVTKFNSDKQKSEKITKQVISTFTLVFYLLILLSFINRVKT